MLFGVQGPRIVGNRRVRLAKGTQLLGDGGDG